MLSGTLFNAVRKIRKIYVQYVKHSQCPVASRESTAGTSGLALNNNLP